ncbi:hypothetical protein NLX83_11380 [Allokutzneria sp. A3M-2-11 16]|uniref:hypothetical protein n=1 Tax=Allokutzneria sp. A3M-2-11 16 TaxID=2962043 RepID=UPI0020B8FDEC|nr:hypothetical protein [Allokutzneria sp. A3M-2-11 16]MCP3799856.1 hypothetical protein [Allokutzneria sp. A3M-2-11 16]
MTSNGYRRLARVPGIGAWLIVVACQRFPVAMAPLGLIYLGIAITGSPAFGALLAGVHAAAEAVLATALGRRFDRRPARSEACLVLAAEALLFLVAGLCAHVLPPMVVGAVAALGGGIAAGAQGGLRSLAVRLAPEAVRPVLGLESAVSATVWTAAPALVAAVALLAGPTAPTLVIAAIAALGALAARFLREPERPSARVAGKVTISWRVLVPACAQAAALMLAMGGASLALPALLPTLGVSADWAGGWLTGMALAGVVSGLSFGAVAWRARPETQATWLLLVVAALTTVVGLAGTPVLALCFLVAVGVMETPIYAARSLALQRAVPEQRWGEAFSALYTAAGVGYGAAGLVTAGASTLLGPSTAIVLCGLSAMVITAATMLVRTAQSEGMRIGITT